MRPCVYPTTPSLNNGPVLLEKEALSVDVPHSPLIQPRHGSFPWQTSTSTLSPSLPPSLPLAAFLPPPLFPSLSLSLCCHRSALSSASMEERSNNGCLLRAQPSPLLLCHTEIEFFLSSIFSFPPPPHQIVLQLCADKYAFYSHRRKKE